MKIQIAKANAFQIDPAKRYLVLVTTPEEWTKEEMQHANEAIRQHFPNMCVVSLKAGAKFKVVESEGKK